MLALAAARFASAPVMSSGEPVITVGKNRVTPVANMARMERADILVRELGRTIIHARKAIHLQVDESWSQSVARSRGESSESTP